MSDLAALPVPRLAVPERLHEDALVGHDPTARVVDIGGLTMGTRWTVRFAMTELRDSASVAAAVQARLDEIVDQMSHWDTSSVLCRYNTTIPGTWISLPADFAHVMAGALLVAERSWGAFDPTLGRLTDLWGLGPRPAATAPDEAEIAAVLAESGWRRLAFDADGQRLRQPGGLWLDLSGIAKGYAADVVADRLAALGVTHALIEVGGECVGRGIRPDGDPWWIEAETPPEYSLAPLRIALHQLAIATSGDYLGGAHTIDPSTGRPPAHRTTVVSVLHASCMMADAWASAFSVLSPAEARQKAEQEQLAVRLLTRDGEEWLSPALTRML